MRSKFVTTPDQKPRRRAGSPRRDQRHFTNTADRVQKENLQSGRPMRGGIRL